MAALLLQAFPAEHTSAVSAQWPLWQAFAQYFVDPQGRVIDRDAEDRTTSEAQAYGLFFSLVAGDRGQFDRILNWTVTNLAEGDLRKRLPAWSWGKDRDGKWRVLDANTASDADLWLAYTLIESGRLWRNERLYALGLSVALRIDAEEIVTGQAYGPWLLPGRTGFRTGRDGFQLNASYLAPQLINVLAAEQPDLRWHAALANVPEVWRGSLLNGFVSDWAGWQGSIRRGPQAGGEARAAAASYDAIRVYLWAGMLHPDFPDREKFLEPLQGMVSYLRRYTVPPERVTVAGVEPRSGPGFSAAVTPLLTTLGEVPLISAQRRRIEEEFDAQLHLYGRPPRYYDQCLILFASGWSDGRFRFDPAGRLIVAWKSE